MSSFGTLYTYPNNYRVFRVRSSPLPCFPRHLLTSPQVHVAAKLNGLKLDTPEFTMGTTNKTPEFLEKFPLGKVPTLEVHATDSTPAVYLAEGPAIAHYVASQGPASGQLLGRTPQEQAKIQQYIWHAETEIYGNTLIKLLMNLGYRPKNEEVEKQGLEGLERMLAVYEKILKGQKWVAGTEEYSMADLSTAGALYWGLKNWYGKGFAEKYPAVKEWYERLLAVPEVKEFYGEPEYQQ